MTLVCSLSKDEWNRERGAGTAGLAANNSPEETNITDCTASDNTGRMYRCRTTLNLINKRTFSSLKVNHIPRLCLPPGVERVPVQLQFSRNVSTLESMYQKLITLPAVHHIEDSLAYIHDATGESR